MKPRTSSITCMCHKYRHCLSSSTLTIAALRPRLQPFPQFSDARSLDLSIMYNPAAPRNAGPLHAAAFSPCPHLFLLLRCHASLLRPFPCPDNPQPHEREVTSHYFPPHLSSTPQGRTSGRPGLISLQQNTNISLCPHASIFACQFHYLSQKSDRALTSTRRIRLILPLLLRLLN